MTMTTTRTPDNTYSIPNNSNTLNHQLINLQRLLYSITKDEAALTATNASAKTRHETASRVHYAQTLLQQLEDTYIQCNGLLQYNDTANDAVEDRLMTQDELQALRDEVERVILIVTSNNSTNYMQKDVIDDVFFTTTYSCSDDDDDDKVNHPITMEDNVKMDEHEFDFDDDEFDLNDQHSYDAADEVNNDDTTAADAAVPVLTEEEYRNANRILNEPTSETAREMQEALESEIAEMASRLKRSSIAMNENLKAQNEDVNRMAELTGRNLDDVTNVTGNVEERLRKRGWLKTFGTWSLVFVIIGSFVGLFMLMRVVPKRKNACVLVFWCNSDAASTSNGGKTFSWLSTLSLKDYSDDDGGGGETVASTVMSSSSIGGDDDDASSGYDVHGDCDAATAAGDGDGECEAATSYNLDDDDEVDDDEEDDDEEEYDYEEGNDVRQEENGYHEEDATEETDDEEIEEFVCNDIGDCNKKIEAVEEQVEPPKVTAQNQQQQHYYHQQEYVHTVTEEQYTAAQLYVEMKKAAIGNDLNQLSQLLQMHHGLEAMNSKDVNGWQIIHESSRVGNIAVVRLLHENGADINEVSNFGRGATPLALARQRFGDHHPVVSYLQSNGAV